MSPFKETLYKIIGDRIKKKRIQLGYNQEKVANAIKLNRTSVSNIEIGKHQIPLIKLYKLTNFLGCDIHLILPTNKEVEDQMTDDPNSDFNSLLDNKIDDEGLKDVLRNLSK